MVRLRILELPTEHHGDDMTTPFVLVVDQCEPQRTPLSADTTFGEFWQNAAERIGARGAVVTPQTIELDGQAYPLVVKVEGDFTGFREQVMREVAQAQAKLRAGTA